MTRDLPVRRGRGRPPGPPVDIERRRELLLDAAEEVVRESGPDVGLADVAAAAGLTRSAVYAAFADRNAVIDALAQRHAHAILGRLTDVVGQIADPAAQTRAAIDILAGWFEDEPRLARLLTKRFDRPTGSSGGLVMSVVTAILQDGFRRRGADTSAAEPWAHALVGAVSATISWWSQTRTMSRTEIVDHLFRLIWSGFDGVGGGVGHADSGAGP